MLYIVNSADNSILAKFDAWCLNCMEKAHEFIQERKLEIVRDEVTFMGDMVYWVAPIAE